ncbi:hypothetical protein [Butyrivibrio sp. AE3006]|uniref:hypothetical protein n=1 Tax=Butyrivibrio sp. AE3006 TaxID=1280673 RepID=UPI00047D87DA|nr:hypothetical protein [Butyrivibrio sp. AE3006]
MDSKKLNAIIYALLAALFYAINIPCSKLLLNNVPTTFMAALDEVKECYDILLYENGGAKKKMLRRFFNMCLPSDGLT